MGGGLHGGCGRSRPAQLKPGLDLGRGRAIQGRHTAVPSALAEAQGAAGWRWLGRRRSLCVSTNHTTSDRIFHFTTPRPLVVLVVWMVHRHGRGRRALPELEALGRPLAEARHLGAYLDLAVLDGACVAAVVSAEAVLRGLSPLGHDLWGHDECEGKGDELHLRWVWCWCCGCQLGWPGRQRRLLTYTICIVVHRLKKVSCVFTFCLQCTIVFEYRRNSTPTCNTSYARPRELAPRSLSKLPLQPLFEAVLRDLDDALAAAPNRFVKHRASVAWRTTRRDGLIADCKETGSCTSSTS